VRVTVKPQPAETKTRWRYTFEDVKPESVTATLRWEKLAGLQDHRGRQSHRASQHQNQLRSVGGFSWRATTRLPIGAWDNNYNWKEP